MEVLTLVHAIRIPRPSLTRFEIDNRPEVEWVGHIRGILKRRRIRGGQKCWVKFIRGKEIVEEFDRPVSGRIYRQQYEKYQSRPRLEYAPALDRAKFGRKPYHARMSDLPQDLHDVHGPFDREVVQAACESLGEFGEATQRLVARGSVAPDVLMGSTLALLAGQPRSDRPEAVALASPIEGNVWVREQFTIHRPCPIDEVWTVQGTSARRYTRKGRRYGVTVSRTFDAPGRLVVSNCTTGLLSYRADESLGDTNEGLQESNVHIPSVDSADPSFAVEVNERHSLAAPAPIEMTLALMQRRDGKAPKNPIHSDPEKARRAGLPAPIAGGSHVAAFAFELLMREWSPDVLLHGAHIDIRWKSPTYAGDVLVPSAVVTSVTPSLITVAVAVEPAKLTGTIVIPRRQS